MAPSAITITEQYAPLILNKNNGSYDNYHDEGEYNATKLIERTLKDRIKNIDTNTCEAGDEDAFYVADLGEVYRQYRRWKVNLPRVRPHYGVFTSTCITGFR